MINFVFYSTLVFSKKYSIKRSKTNTNNFRELNNSIKIKDIFNKGNRNKLYRMDANRADAFALLSSLCRVVRRLKEGERNKTKNRSSDRVQ